MFTNGMNRKLKGFRLRAAVSKLMYAVMILGLVLSVVRPTTVLGGTASGLDDLAYTEGDGWVYLDSSVTVSSTTNDWSDGYIDIEITGNGSPADQLRIQSSGNLTVVGDAVSWNGTRIGTIDPVRNGVNGQPLRINFSASLKNAGFETGDFTDWVVNTNFPGLAGDTPNGIYQDASVVTSPVSSGNYAAKLHLTGNVSVAYGTAHGPTLTSSSFYAKAGNNLSLTWRAEDSGDDYDVYGYINNVATGTQQQLFYDRGDNTGGWVNLNSTIDSTVCPSGVCELQFQFIAGTYDASGGKYVGTTMYIDGIQIVTTAAQDDAVDYIVEHIEYENTSDNPKSTKPYKLTMKDSGSTGTATATINITGVNDAPTDIQLSNDNIQENQPVNTVIGALTTSDPDDTTFTYTLVAGTGDDDNASFNISGNNLRSSEIFDYETKNTYTVRIRSTDSHAASTEKSFTIHVTNQNEAATAFTNGAPPDGDLGVAYNFTFAANGDPTPTYSVSSGSLPPGLTLNATTGVVSGTPTAAGTYNFEITATNVAGSYSKDYSIKINKGNATTTIVTDLPDPSKYGQNYAVAVSVTSAVSIVPTGTVTVTDGTHTCQVTLSGGVGSCNLPSTSIGAVTITATYPGNANYNGSSDTEAHTIEKANTTTTITSDAPDPSKYGQNYSVSVSVSSDTTAVPTGTVNVSDGTNSCTATLSGGSGSCDLPSTSVGAATITATYAANTNFNASSGTEGHTVEKANTTVTITGDAPDASVYGQNYTVAVSVTADTTAVPTGTVNVSDGTNSCTATLSSGSGSCVLPSTSAGGITVTATYPANANFNASSGTEGHTVEKANTTTAVNRSVVSPVYGQPVSFTATVSTVSPGSYTPEGMVQFYIDGSAFGSPVALSGGTATSQSTTALDVGSHTYYAEYLGDSNNNPSDSMPATSFGVSKNSTTTSVVSSKTPSVYGEAIHLTATVTEVAPSVVTPVGQVQFYVDGTAAGSPVALDASGNASSPDLHTLLAGGHLKVGTHTFSASYLGNSNTLASASGDENQVVNPAATTLTIASSENPTIYGTTLAMTITVAQENASLMTPQGTVQMYIDGVKFGSVMTLDANGKAYRTVPYMNLWPGHHDITGVYTPATPAQFQASNNNAHPLDQVVNKADPVITISADVTNPVASEKIQYSVVISPSMPTQGTPSGTVQFYLDGSPVGSPVTLDSQGRANCPELVALDTGTHNITVRYSGDDYFNSVPTSSAYVHHVSKADTTTAIQSITPTESVVGQAVTVNIQVDPVSPAAGTPTGTFTVTNGTDSCTGTLLASGAGSCALHPTSPGIPNLTAQYGGSANFNASVSSAFNGPKVSKANTVVTITGYDPTSPIAYQAVTITFTVDPVAPGAGTPTGLVTVSDDQGHTCSATVSAGSCQLTFESIGQVTLTATYAGDANFNPSTTGATTGPVVQKAQTTSVVASAKSPTVYGEPVAFTATVTVDSPASGTPTGQVQFSIDGTNLGSPVTLTNGKAVSSQIHTLAVGTHHVKATYLGNDDLDGSESAAIDQVVEKADTLLTITSEINPSPYGMPVMVTTTVTGAAPSLLSPKSGTVQFYIDGVAYGSPVPLKADGTANKLLPYTALWVGTHQITAVYSGNASFNGCNNTAAPLLQVVEGGNLTISIEETVGNPVFGQSLAITATVTGNGSNNPKPSGTVKFYLDGVLLGTQKTLNGSGKALSDAFSHLSVGLHDVKVEYSGDDYYKPSVQIFSEAIEISKADAAIQLLGSVPNSVVVGEPFTVTYTVTASLPGAGTPTGLVTVSNGSDTCSALVSVGKCQITPSAAGVQHLNATYSGDGNFNVATTTSAMTGTTVNKADVSLAITNVPAGPVYVRQPYSVTVHVAAVAPGTHIPVGKNITISNGVDSCIAVVAADGTATCQILPTQATSGSPLKLTATFAGDSNFNSATSAQVSGPTVNKGDTTTTVETSKTMVKTGESVQFTAHVNTQSPPGGTADGSVQFTVDGVNFGPPVALSSGVATLSTASLATGKHQIKANYQGSSSYNASSSSAVAVTVVDGDKFVEVSPAITTTLVYTHVQKGAVQTTTITIPAGAVSQTVSLVYKQVNPSSLLPPTGLTFVSNFNLKVYVDGVYAPNYDFIKPIVVRMTYDPKNWQSGTLDVSGWNGTTWNKTWLGSFANNETEGWMDFTIAGIHDLEFALSGKTRKPADAYKVFLPIIFP